MSLDLTEMGSWSMKVGGTGIGDKFRVPEVWAFEKIDKNLLLERY